MYLYVGSSSRVHPTIGTTAQASPVSGLAHHPQQQTYTDEELSEFICESESHNSAIGKHQHSGYM